jgi:hypothetical protein
MAQSQPTTQHLTQAQLDAIHQGLANAGLGDFRISVLHLKHHRGPRSLGAAAAPLGRSCHSHQLPNGDWVIVCDP